MGYSARYHAASLAAIFLALAIGILIGTEFGGDVLTETKKDIEQSLTSDLDNARSEIDDLNRDLGWSDDFGNRVYPLLTDSRLAGDRIGLVAFGDLPSAITKSVETAIKPSGGKLVAVGAIRQPPTVEQIGQVIGANGKRAKGSPEELLEKYGFAVGRQLVNGGRVLNETRSDLMSQSSGQFGNLDGLVLFRGDLTDLESEDLAMSERLDDGIIDGAASTRVKMVGVEQFSTEPSSIDFFKDHQVSSVDNIEQPAGKVSLVFALGGAEGSFGVKEGADRVLPELLKPVEPAGGQDSGQRTGGKQG
jgi:Copper transport outer membrane protein, MctB